MKSDPPVVLFLGEASVVDPLVHAFVDERMDASSQTLDFEIFRFGERPLQGIEPSLRQVGMFSAKRCIWLRGFVEEKRKAGPLDASSDDDTDALREDGAAAEGEQEATTAGLLELLEAGVPPGVLFVVSCASLDARGRLSKWFAKHADVRDHRVQVEHSGQRRGKLGEHGLRDAIAQRLKDVGVLQVGAGAVDEIVKRSGNVLGETLQEVDRVVLAQDDPTRLSVAGVRQAMRDLAQGWVFDFTDALEKRDLAAAENLVERLLAEGEAPLRISALVGTHVAKLVAARPLVDSLPPGWQRMRATDFFAGPGASLPDFLKGWGGYFRLKAAANFGPGELRRIHGEIRVLDEALKSSPMDPLLLFSRLLQAACLGGARR